MRLEAGQIYLSASDLMRFQGCSHAIKAIRSRTEPIELRRATYLLPTDYEGGFRRYHVIDLTKRLSLVAIAESEISNLRAGL